MYASLERHPVLVDWEEKESLGNAKPRLSAFVILHKRAVAATATTLSGTDGPIENCLRLMQQLDRLIPSDSVPITGNKKSKRKKVQLSLTTLA